MFQPFPPYHQFIAAQAAPAPIHYPPPIGAMPAHTTASVQRPTQTEQPKVVLLGKYAFCLSHKLLSVNIVMSILPHPKHETI